MDRASSLSSSAAASGSGCIRRSQHRRRCHGRRVGVGACVRAASDCGRTAIRAIRAIRRGVVKVGTAAAFALAAALLPVACYDARFSAPEAVVSSEAASEHIASLRERYAGTPFVVSTPIVVEGTVTSSDRAGNFYRTLCVEENRAALEVVAGIDQLHNDFPVGCRVAVRLEGLTVGQSYGVLQVGRAPAPGSAYEVDFLASRAALGRVVVRLSEALDPALPTSRTIAELRPEMAGTLVRIGFLRYAPDQLIEASWTGYKRFEDAAGNSIYSYVRSYADFADESVPVGEVALVGILQYDDSGEGRYLIKLRDENDCIPL